MVYLGVKGEGARDPDRTRARALITIGIERENLKRDQKKFTRKVGDVIALQRAATAEVGAVVHPGRVQAAKGTEGIYVET